MKKKKKCWGNLTSVPWSAWGSLNLQSLSSQGACQPNSCGLLKTKVSFTLLLKLNLCSQQGMGPERLSLYPGLGKTYEFYISKFIWMNFNTERETTWEILPFLDWIVQLLRYCQNILRLTFGWKVIGPSFSSTLKWLLPQREPITDSSILNLKEKESLKALRKVW